MTNNNSRRIFMKTGVALTLGTFGVSQIPLAFARTGEDPVAIIEGFANQLFDLFGPLNGTSDSHASRRAALKAVVESRFAYDTMAETAAAVAVPDMNAEQRARLHAVGSDLVVEFLLSFFVSYTSEQKFVAQGVRESRSGNRSMLDTLLIANSGQNIPIRWDLIERDGRCMVFDVRVLGISMIKEVTTTANRGYENGGMYLLFRVLDRRVDSFRGRFPE